MGNGYLEDFMVEEGFVKIPFGKGAFKPYLWLEEMLLELLGIYNQPVSVTRAGTQEGVPFLGWYNEESKQGCVVVHEENLNQFLGGLEVGSVVP